jgi:hypothetical protein
MELEIAQPADHLDRIRALERDIEKDQLRHPAFQGCEGGGRIPALLGHDHLLAQRPRDDAANRLLVVDDQAKGARSLRFCRTGGAHDEIAGWDLVAHLFPAEHTRACPKRGLQAP